MPGLLPLTSFMTTDPSRPLFSAMHLRGASRARVSMATPVASSPLDLIFFRAGRALI